MHISSNLNPIQYFRHPHLLVLLLLLSFDCISFANESPFAATANLPALSNGRILPLNVAVKTFVYDYYHSESLKQNDLKAFNAKDPSALSLLWNMHFSSPSAFADTPFFWIHHANVKKALNLNSLEDRFSFNTLHHALYGNPENNLTKQNLEKYAQLFQSLKSFQELFNKDSTNFYEEMFEQLKRQGMTPAQIAIALETKFPLQSRLKKLSPILRMLPLKSEPYELVNLQAFSLKIFDPSSKTLELIDNFTAFADEDFYPLRQSYSKLEDAVIHNQGAHAIQAASEEFSKLYLQGFEALVHTPYKLAKGKALLYPPATKLILESWMHDFPLIECATLSYCIALLILSISPSKLSFIFMGLGFLFHTLALGLRIYILARPPVSNMFETVIYVPWVGLIIGFIIYNITKVRIALIASLTASIALLILLKVTKLNMKLENVQAVLDSQYWLIVHVLMVVGSYGAFLVSGVIAHFYLLRECSKNFGPGEKAKLAKTILHTMYIGVALLIPGTILGGVWAAESWGRFWDWDPKESWAFITACIYLLIIHAYTFKKIGDLGLAIGAIFGMMAVSFTWYGVNYVLGIGLHTYGFGKGGEFYYFIYLGAEILFILSLRPWKRIHA